MPWPAPKKVTIVSAEDFFSRWSKKNEEARKAEADAAQAGPQTASPASPAGPGEPSDPYAGRTPTQEDLDQLTPQSDFSAFMKQGVDEDVKRSALKKLFSDPHFNIMDGLDIYIDDYGKPDPIPPEMLAMLVHAKDLFNPAGLLDRPHMAMRSELDLPPEISPDTHPALAQDLPPEAPASEGAADAAQEGAPPLASEPGQPAQSEQNAEQEAAKAAKQEAAEEPSPAAGQTGTAPNGPPTEQHPAPTVAGNHTSGTHPETETRKP